MVIVDLDGTLLVGNSFPMFVKYLLRKNFCWRRLLSFLSLGGWNVLRKAGFISHRRLKWAVMRVADGTLDDSDYEEFALLLQRRLRPRVAGYIAGRDDVLLSTAASEEYVAPLARMLSVRYVATRRPSSGRFSDYKECRGEEKVRLVQSMGASIDEVMTDHDDDLPLLKACSGRRILVSPTLSTLAAVDKAGIPVEIWSEESPMA